MSDNPKNHNESNVEVKNVTNAKISVSVEQNSLTQTSTSIPKFIPNPFPQSPTFFTGRQDVLENLLLALQTYKNASLCGIKGLGKSSVVYKFAEVNAENYQHIFLVSADKNEFDIKLLQLCEQLSVTFDATDNDESKARKFCHKIGEICDSLAENKPLLLIFDNVDNVSHIAKFVPTHNKLQVVFTSNFERISDIGHTVEINNLSDDEANLLLYRKATKTFVNNLDNVSLTEKETISQITTLLGNHPFALSIAGLYIRENRKTFAKYLERLQNSQGKILKDENGVDAYQHPNIYSAFLIPFEDILQAKDDSEEEQTTTRILLECMKIASLLFPNEMPEEVFIETLQLIFPDYVEYLKDEDNWNKIYRKLSLYGFFERNGNNSTFTVHRLFHLFLCNKLEDKVETMEETLAQVLANNFEFFDFTNKVIVEHYLSHIEVFLEYLEANKLQPQANLKLENKSTALLCDKYASYFGDYGQYQKAQKYYEFYKDICESVKEIDETVKTTSYNNLALLYYSQGKYELAEPLYKKALEIREKVLGENHSDTATSYNNLAGLYDSQGKYELAELLYKKALEIREKVLGENHLYTAISYNNLAVFYRSQGKYELAKPLYKKALEIREKELGELHPDTATSYNNLASLYESQGKYELAEPLYKKVIEIFEKELGELHPNTATSYNNLAELYRSQGKYELAEPLYKKALKIREKVLGENHPDTATSYNNLGVFYANQENFTDAKVWLQKALLICQNVLGEKHPDTIQTKESLKYVEAMLR
ncbi:MAG: tetratricopeptide repeat protein [Pyrinomonadaceae bacterium]|jgi:tetratricopeptide (TPR) repeat protein|nr:tetratricopeptide repeat protein [Pyrinomonadaceae bacterium]